MPLRVEPHAEPIPGYRLLERIGAGGFGEVWKAEAPGGLLKAIKVVFGDLRANDPDGNHDLARQELKALKRVQAVRHPYLLGIDRYDVIDGRLLIVTELADGNLWDRFRQSREAGLQGIPRDDLIRYLLEAAEVLDLMHDRHQLQHLDIKPPNIFLVHDHVKVGDFGLVKDLEGVQGMISGGVTPHYAAPETFDGHLSRHCDQYSLAIVYAELLTGQRPFGGGTVQQIILQHIQSKPNLAALPPSDRPIVSRALSKDPAKRFPNCSEFVGMLFDMSGGGFRMPASLLASLTGRYAKAEPPASPTPPPAMPAAEPPAAPTTPIPHHPATRYRTGDGCLQPALVIGLGGVGRTILQRLRQRLHDDLPGDWPQLRFLYLDTDADALQAALDGRDGPALASDEVLPIRLQRAGHYLKPRLDGQKITDGWFDSQLLGRLPRQPATLGVRALGRLAFADHAVTIAGKLRDELAAVTRPDALDAAVRRTGLGLRTTQPRVVIAAGLGGATGGGIALDIAYLARRALTAAGDMAPDVGGVFVLPPTSGATPADVRATGNAFAMLTELLHFSRPDTKYIAAVGGLDSPPQAAPPFASILAMPAADGSTLAADAILRELVTPLGRALAGSRGSKPAEPVARSYGVARFIRPAAALNDRTACRLTAATLERWLAPETNKLKGAVNAWVAEQWAAQELGPETLTRRIHAAVDAALGQPADAAFAIGVREGPLDALVRFEEWVGRGRDGDDPGAPGRLEAVLADATAALAAEWGGKLASLAVCLLEQPGFRFAGAVRAVALLRDGVERAQTHFAPLGDEWLRKASQASARVHALLGGLQPRRAAPNELGDALTLLPRWRLQGLVLKAVSAVYAALREPLDAAPVEIGACRRQVEDALTALRSRDEAQRVADPPPDAPGVLLPDGCTTLDEAVTKLIDGLSREEWRTFDAAVQGVLETRFGGLVSACLAAPDAAAHFGPLLTDRAAAFVASRTAPGGAVEAFLARFADPSAAGRELAAAFEAAEPAFGTYGAPELAALAVPPGPQAEAFRELANRSLVPLELIAATSPTDVALVRERPAVPLTALPAMGLEALEAYRLLSRADGLPPHARTDVADWTA